MSQIRTSGGGTITFAVPQSIAGRLKTDDFFGTSMALLAMDCGYPAKTVFGFGYSTLQKMLEDRYGAAPSPDNTDRLMAAITVLTTDLFWRDVESFVTVANVLSGSGLTTVVEDPADVRECSWAVTEAALLDPEAAKPSPDVITYMNAACREYGYPVPPAALKRVGVVDNTRVLFAWSDAAEVVEKARQDAAEVDQWVAEEVDRLLDQIADLPLRGADARKAVESLRKRNTG